MRARLSLVVYMTDTMYRRFQHLTT